ncbi:hypothetical protein ACN42_g8919, partial [Penicillium freii]
ILGRGYEFPDRGAAAL